ncbi:MAG TPA: transporter substrate-binding domain-containing protein [Cytophagales bacterium]|nr:transporter substrate-binding domain-containing protein [Cytophagales bacterium]
MKCLLQYLFLAFLLVFACQPKKQQTKLGNELSTDVVKIDLQQIKKRGKLIAVTESNTTGYFVYKGQPMGFQYEMLKRLANQYDVKLEILVCSDIGTGLKMLDEGKCDILAQNLIANKSRTQKITFTEHHSLAKQVLVQRKPKGWQKLSHAKVEKFLVKTPYGLIDKMVHVKKGSFYTTKLKHLSEEIGGDIKIKESFSDDTTEDLIRKVANGEIDFTVADENEAYVLSKYYSNLDVTTSLSLPQRMAWAVRKNAPDLLQSTNSWLKKIKRTNEYFAVFDKYYRSSKSYARRVNSPYFSHNNRLSKYDNLIKKNAQKLNWDWRLLASLVYQESKFDPMAQSHVGAMGLMQLMPATAERFGATDVTIAEQSIAAGTSYLIYLDKFWKKRIPDNKERVKFILASYNAGQGHVLDAYKLTAKYEKDKSQWDENVATFLLQKSYPKYYTDPVVKLGYCRGKEPVKYVNEVFQRYEHYKNLIKG